MDIVCWLGDIWHVVMFKVLCNNSNRITSWWEINRDFKYIIFNSGVIRDINFNVERVEIFVTVTSSDTGTYPFPNLLFFQLNFADEQYLSFFVWGSHNFIVSLLLVYPIIHKLITFGCNIYPITSAPKRLDKSKQEGSVMGYILHPKVMSLWIMGFFTIL